MITLIKRYTLLAGVALAVLLALILFIRVHLGGNTGVKPPVPTAGAVLPSNDKEQILVDPVKHTLIIVKPTGNQTLSLPDRPSIIDIRKDGTVQVTSPQYGWEHMAFMGIQASRYVRIAAGMDAFYFKKLDVGLGVATQVGEHPPIAFVQLAYNVWSNCRVGIEYGTDRLIGGTISVRL